MTVPLEILLDNIDAQPDEEGDIWVNEYADGEDD